MQPAIQQQTIKDKAPKPAGLVPKNLQAFVLVGLALLMVLIMALTGHKRPAPTANSETTTSVPNLVPLNTDKVTDFEKRIEDTQRASAPQAEAALLRQQKQLAAEGTGPAQPFPSSPYGTPVTSPNPNGAYPPGAYASALPQPVEGQPAADPLKGSDGPLAIFRARHLHEAEPARLVRVPIPDDGHSVHPTVSCKQLADVLFTCIEVEVSDENVLHGSSPQSSYLSVG